MANVNIKDKRGVNVEVNVGDYYLIKGILHILVRVDRDLCSLVSVVDGNRWNTPKKTPEDLITSLDCEFEAVKGVDIILKG